MPQGPFQPIYPNPYIAGNPIRNKEMFFGRVDEFRFIARLLDGGHKTALIVLYGERRSGKSSILYQILNGELGEAFLPIFVDMQIMAGIANDAEFFGRMITDACRSLAQKGLAAEPYTGRLQSANAAETFRKFLEDLKKQNPHRALVLLIDEYEILELKIAEGSLSRHVLPFFAGLLETEQVSFVFTGSRKLEAHDQTLWQGELLRKATSRKISFLTSEDSARLVTQPLHGKVTFAPEVVAAIYSLTAGQPFYTQLICQNLVYHLNEVKKREVTSDDLRAVVDGIIENPPPQLLFNWSELSQERKLTLAALAEFSEPEEVYSSADDLGRRIARSKLGMDLDRNFLNTELAGLLQDEYVLQKGRRYSYRLDLYRRWVRHDHSIWQVKKEIGPREMARITKLARKKKAKRRRTISILEHVLLVILAVIGAVLAKNLIDLIWPDRIEITANAGPFALLLDGGSVDTIETHDSTPFVYDAKKLRNGPHEFKAILLATGEALSKTVLVSGGIKELFRSRTMTVRFQFLESPVLIALSANAGPFEVLVDEQLVGTTRGQEDSTVFFYTERLRKGAHTIKAILLASGEVSSKTVEIVEAETAKIRIVFPESEIVISTDAESFAAELNGKKVVDTKGQIGGWRGVFRVAKGNYRLRVTDWSTKEVQEKSITVSASDSAVNVDFQRVVVLTLKAKSPFQYQYAWQDEDHLTGSTSWMQSSGANVVIRRGIEKGSYQFTFVLDGKRKQIPNVPIRSDTTIVFATLPNYRLTIVSIDPPAAKVLLHGVEIGQTPFNREFEEGDYDFQLAQEGYDTLQVPVKLDRHQVITESLAAQYGLLLVVVQDEKGRAIPDAKIYLNDGKEPWDKAPMNQKKIRAGRYKITTRSSGYWPDNTYCDIQKDELETVKAVLRK
jgi:AAA+ ATPase superfamily predicted ATPase